MLTWSVAHFLFSFFSVQNICITTIYASVRMLCGSSIPYVICSCGGTLFNKRCRKCNIKLCFDCVLLQDGFVTCAIRTCPVLSCQSQTRRNGTCCPVCQGIVVLLINQLNLVLKLQVNYRTVSTEHGS